ncbi:thermonuclease family protein [Ruegeria sp. AD91A]|uniref:thermonuclease family protein n=1 Tax=Ruegeria sp. AD91A TaxID=2293862 RepID=UPI0020C797EF|nr:thermonuclease family protein [Ruegeria sp. AD91A]
MKKSFWLIVSAALMVGNMATAGQTIEGKARAIDGDTILVAGVKVRLNGVDAMELGTQAGQQAKAATSKIVHRKNVTCELNGERSYDRMIGVCYANSEDVAAVLIANGYALDCARYSGGRYKKYETRAARSRLAQANYCR